MQNALSSMSPRKHYTTQHWKTKICRSSWGCAKQTKWITKSWRQNSGKCPAWIRFNEFHWKFVPLFKATLNQPVAWSVGQSCIPSSRMHLVSANKLRNELLTKWSTSTVASIIPVVCSDWQWMAFAANITELSIFRRNRSLSRQWHERNQR